MTEQKNSIPTEFMKGVTKDSWKKVLAKMDPENPNKTAIKMAYAAHVIHGGDKMPMKIKTVYNQIVDEAAKEAARQRVAFEAAQRNKAWMRVVNSMDPENPDERAVRAACVDQIVPTSKEAREQIPEKVMDIVDAWESFEAAYPRAVEKKPSSNYMQAENHRRVDIFKTEMAKTDDKNPDERVVRAAYKASQGAVPVAVHYAVGAVISKIHKEEASAAREEAIWQTRGVPADMRIDTSKSMDIYNAIPQTPIVKIGRRPTTAEVASSHAAKGGRERGAEMAVVAAAG